MKRFLLIILLLPLFTCSQQFGFVNTGDGSDPPVEESCGTPTALGEIIRDEFTGTSLSANWTVTNPGSQTITVSGDRLRVQANNGTNKNAALNIRYTGYQPQGGFSTLSNYTVTLWDVQFNSIDASTFGPIVGVEPRANDANLAAGYANIDPSSGTPSMEIWQTSNTYAIGNSVTSTSGVPAINTSDSYNLIFTVDDGEVTATVVNVTAGTSKSVTYSYSASTANPRIPPIFVFAMGATGTTDFDCAAFSVSSTELSAPRIVFMGDSITKGFNGGDFDLAYPYRLRSHTACDIQIMAGPGNNATDSWLNRHEVINVVSPGIVILFIGHNDSPGGGIIPNTMELLVADLESAGKTVYILTIINGGDPATPGTFNANLSVSFNPAQVIDIYTDYISVMLANPGTYMADALHPNATGFAFLTTGIKTKLPLLFPL